MIVEEETKKKKEIEYNMDFLLLAPMPLLHAWMQRMSYETNTEEEIADHLQYHVAYSKIGHTSGEEACPRKSKAVIVFWKGWLERGKKKSESYRPSSIFKGKQGKGRQWNR